MVSVEASVCPRQFQAGLEGWCGRGESHRSAEGTISVGRCSDTSLNLDAAQQGSVGVHIGPKYGLVFGRVERHAIQCDVDSAARCAADAHVSCSRACTVLAPCEHAWRASKKERQLLPTLGEGFQFLTFDVGHGKWCVLGCADTLHNYLLHRLRGKRVGGCGGLLCLHSCRTHQCGRGCYDFFHVVKYLITTNKGTFPYDGITRIRFLGYVLSPPK